MLVNKTDLIQVLKQFTKEFALSDNWSEKLSTTLWTKHGVLRGETLDAIREQKNMEEYSEMFLYFLCEGMFLISEKEVLDTKKYFSQVEISEYSDVYLSEQPIEFPMVLHPVLQISEDQWMTVTNSDFLLKLKRNQLINYNPNTQRSMIKTIRGGKTYYKISLNEKSVKAISTSMKENKFIPNTITLNIPDGKGEFYYDSETLTLHINSLECFDIIDGYHRYIAIGKTKEKNEQFDYPMELRIVNFSEAKSRSFIFQEDQRNQMKKIDSKSLDSNDIGNAVSMRLNYDPACVFNNQINNTGGLINYSEFSECIRFYFCKNIDIQQRNVFVLELKKYLNDCLEQLVEYDSKFVTGEFKYDFKALNIIMYIFSQYKENGISLEAFKEIDILLANVEELNNNVFSRTTITKTNANKIESLRKKVCKNV